MRKIGIIVSCMAVACIMGGTVQANEVGAVQIEETNFPDQYFRQYVAENIDTDQNGYLSQQECSAVTYIGDDQGAISKGTGECASLKGIEYFVNLDSLNCANEKLTELDLSGLTKVYFVKAANNQLQSLNVRDCKELTMLDCSNNQIKELNLDNQIKMYQLFCKNNQLKKLKVNHMKSLWMLNCNNNELEELDLSQNVIYSVFCENNNLVTLKLGMGEDAALHVYARFNYLSNPPASGVEPIVYLISPRKNYTFVVNSDDVDIPVAALGYNYYMFKGVTGTPKECLYSDMI